MCASALVSPDARAQTFGVKAGVTSSSVAFDSSPPPADPRAARGFLIGGFLGIPIGGRLTLQAEALLVERRTDFADGPDAEALFTDTLRYLEVPLLGRYHLFSWTGASVAVEGGLGFSRMLTAREEYDGGDDDIAPAIESRELSAMAGAVVEWRRIVAGVRYQYGLTDIYRADSFPARGRALQVSVGYRLH